MRLSLMGGIECVDGGRQVLRTTGTHLQFVAYSLNHALFHLNWVISRALFRYNMP